MISCSWFEQWKRYTGFYETPGGGRRTRDDSNTAEDTHPGSITNKDIIESRELVDAASREVHIKDNLKESVDFIIVNPQIWDFLHSIYGG